MSRPYLAFEALGAWPEKPTSPRKGNPFKSQWNDTRRLLVDEAERIGASDVIVGVVARETDMLRSGDGFRADRKATHPGVVVRLVGTRHGDLRYACDTFEAWYHRDEDSWKINARAVALGLEALRRVERYGIGSRGEQYVGWKALGSGIAVGAVRAPMTLDEAAAMLAGAVAIPGGADAVLTDPVAARSAYRNALRLLHPDHGGSGDGERMSRLQEAWDLVKGHHERVGA